MEYKKDRGKSGDKHYSNTFVSSSSGASSSKDGDRKKQAAKQDDDNDYPNCEKRSSHTFKSRTSRERSPSPTSPKRRHRKSRSPSPTSSKKRRRRSRSRSPSNKHSRGHYESSSHSKHYGGGGGDRDRASGGKSRQQARYDMMQQCLKQQEEQGQVNLDLTVAVAGASNQPQPSSTNTAAKLVQEIEKRKSLFSKKAQSSEPTGSVWNSTSLTNDSDGKMTAKFKRLMGIKGADTTTTGAVSTEKPQASNRNQEEYLANLEKQYEVARTITHTQRGVGLGFGSSGMSSSRQ